MREDIHWLATALGRTIRHFEGPACFDAVEQLREASRDRRRGVEGAPALGELLQRVDGMQLDVLAIVARAFTLFFLLSNVAEQAHRVRRREQLLLDGDAQARRGTLGAILEQLREQGHGAHEVAQVLSRLRIRPVLTAHPTEARRRTRDSAGSSDLRLNPHLHGVFLDGVFVEDAEGELGFVELPELSDMDVAELLQTIVARVLGHLRRQDRDAIERILTHLGFL